MRSAIQVENAVIIERSFLDLQSVLGQSCNGCDSINHVSNVRDYSVARQLFISTFPYGSSSASVRFRIFDCTK